MITKQEVNKIFAAFSAQNPAPKTELEAPNPYCLLVAIILSAQATDVGVNKATPALFRAANSPPKMVALGEAGIRNYIKTIGLFNAKAKNIYAMSKRLIEVYGGRVPQDREALETLPGVGRKTANVWLNCVLGAPTIAVDTHVFRVANRIGLAQTKTPVQTEEALHRIIPDKWKQHAHHWLILHGRYVCKARKPLCDSCIIRQWCKYQAK